jgi:hypothetical protein
MLNSTEAGMKSSQLDITLLGVSMLKASMTKNRCAKGKQDRVHCHVGREQCNQLWQHKPAVHDSL